MSSCIHLYIWLHLKAMNPQLAGYPVPMASRPVQANAHTPPRATCPSRPASESAAASVSRRCSRVSSRPTRRLLVLEVQQIMKATRARPRLMWSKSCCHQELESEYSEGRGLCSRGKFGARRTPPWNRISAGELVPALVVAPVDSEGKDDCYDWAQVRLFVISLQRSEVHVLPHSLSHPVAICLPERFGFLRDQADLPELLRRLAYGISGATYMGSPRRSGDVPRSNLCPRLRQSSPSFETTSELKSTTKMKKMPRFSSYSRTLVSPSTATKAGLSRLRDVKTMP